MPAKKAASKKRKKVTASRKKVAARKPASRKKVAKKKVSKKNVSKKNAPAKKKAAKKTLSKKKVSKKKAIAKKKVAKKAVAKKKASKKKAPAKKKVAKKVAKKAAGKKAAVRKKVSVKKPAAKAAVKKKVPVRNKAPARTAKRRRDPMSGPIHGIPTYNPARGEEYMSDKQILHFGKILSAWKNELMFEVDRTVHHMQDEAANFPDPNDRATQESEFGLELRTRDRERKLLRKIDSALGRLDDGSYGFCDETGEEIGLKRLEARPVATLSLEAQERREKAGRQFRDRDDRYR